MRSLVPNVRWCLLLFVFLRLADFVVVCGAVRSGRASGLAVEVYADCVDGVSEVHFDVIKPLD